MPSRLTLRARLALACTLAVAVVGVGIVYAAFVVIRNGLERQLDVQLVQQATLTKRMDRDLTPGVVSGECAFLAAPACSQVVPASADADPVRPYLLPVKKTTRDVAAGIHPGYYTNISVQGHQARMFTTSLGHGKAVQVALRSDTVHDGVARAARAMSLIGVSGVVLAAFLGYVIARTGLRPVARLTEATERIASTRDPGRRVRLPTPPRGRRDEVTRLATTFNTMLSEVEQSVSARRRLVADASHELRTPLTALRTNAELLSRADQLTPQQLDRAGTALQRQLREITSLVNDLIELAREEEPSPMFEVVRLDLLARQCVETARSHWPGMMFTAEVAAGDTTDYLVEGVPARLGRLLSNLLDNAAKFSPPGGPVVLRITGIRATDEQPAAVELVLRDHGPGISPDDLPHVFDRFYRAASARALPGSGLGLAMARQIAVTHHASIAAEAAPGGGSLFRVRFAAAEAPAEAADDRGTHGDGAT